LSTKLLSTGEDLALYRTFLLPDLMDLPWRPSANHVTSAPVSLAVRVTEPHSPVEILLSISPYVVTSFIRNISLFYYEAYYCY